MRSEIGKITLDRTFEEREALNKNIINAIEKEVHDWGILALRYEIKDIEPPEAIQNSMILQADAERRKRANILKSEGEKMSSINVAEAEKRAAILKAEGLAESMILQATASAQALSSIDKTLKNGNGLDAAKFLLGQRYIEAYGNLARKENTLVLPTEPVDVRSQVQESLQFFQGVDGGQQI